MPIYSFDATLNKSTAIIYDFNLKRKIERLFNITFEYYLPDDSTLWQNPYHGSIRILNVIDIQTNQIIPMDEPTPIEDIIQIRHECWEYLESSKLYLITNMIPIDAYPMRYSGFGFESSTQLAEIIPFNK